MRVDKRLDFEPVYQGGTLLWHPRTHESQRRLERNESRSAAACAANRCHVTIGDAGASARNVKPDSSFTSHHSKCRTYELLLLFDRITRAAPQPPSPNPLTAARNAPPPISPRPTHVTPTPPPHNPLQHASRCASFFFFTVGGCLWGVSFECRRCGTRC